MKKLLMIALIAITAIACNKNQSAVKKLDGEWKATKLIFSNKPTINYATVFDYRLIFNVCDLKDNEYCSMTTKITFDTDVETETGFFKVTSDGTVLILSEDAANGDDQTLTIVDLSSDKLKLTLKEGNDTIEFELEKQ